MSKTGSFQEQIQNSYQFKGESIVLGTGMLEGEVVPETLVKIPLKTMNRHGLIAGATGTGKTKSLQLLAEGLSDASVPVLLMDIKGDLSGLAAEGSLNEKIKERYQFANLPFRPAAYPIELLSISQEQGVRMRSTVSEFGPVLLAKIFALNDTQEGLLSVLFKYCDDKHLPLLDLQDLIKTIQFLSNEGRAEIEKDYGKIATTSMGTILRKVIELQQQGADDFFGEPSFEIDDLMRISNDGRGIISIIRLADMQAKPKLFSTFMLGLLSELYATMPEEGDLDKPKLVIFIDEAHLVFQEANGALLQKIETIIKLIRSKGVGIYFCTQNPVDIPASVLAQLGLKVQHALRAFTANDRKAIRQAAQNYPMSDFYDTETLLTQLGIGEAFITALNEKGVPTALVASYMLAPKSRMDILSQEEQKEVVSRSKIAPKYAEVENRESAYEILSSKIETAVAQSQQKAEEKKATKEKTTLETILDSPITRQVGRTAANIITRTILGSMGLGGRRKKWF